MVKNANSSRLSKQAARSCYRTAVYFSGRKGSQSTCWPPANLMMKIGFSGIPVYDIFRLDVVSSVSGQKMLRLNRARDTGRQRFGNVIYDFTVCIDSTHAVYKTTPA
ncbi:hypothetical protein ElyMa_006284700 [Elysia marginata]|uniref:Uncharacterized protein n=1 Tax=Elysia marginata TaxID=1093978 RepID=A0AAV4HER3_9GAST|nr:hypothetical protein ElyMa_006284700 [Elysia marginata]